MAQQYAVRTYPHAADGTPLTGGVIVGKASSRTAAIRVCRKAGYRVMTVGGCSDLYAPVGQSAEWWITVWA